MKLILAGGGDPQDSEEVDLFFHELLNQKKILFLPHAVSPEIWSVDEALNWLKSQKIFNDCTIDVWENLKECNMQDISSYDALYLMGGNTYKLIDTIRTYELEPVFNNFVAQDKIIYGLSAGAIIMGSSIETANTGPEKDENYLNICNMMGLNYLNNHIIAVHYIEETKKELTNMAKELNKKIIAIPETSGIYIDGRNAKVIGRDSVLLFSDNKILTINPQENFLL